MSEIAIELLLRLTKVLVALVIGVVIYVVVTSWFGATPGAELAVLSWLAGAATVLLLETNAF